MLTGDIREDLIARITAYLLSGGLFNPEQAIHDRVRELLIECRDELQRPPDARLTEENEALRKDAERFRFLKRVYFDIKMSAFQLIGPTSTPEELDATIDAAIKEGS